MANVIDIDIFSKNCNGLSDKAKRIAVFNKLQRKKSGIFILQETHSTAINEYQWSQDWGCKEIYFSHGTSNQRGVLIAMSKNYDVTIHKVARDKHGRYIILIAERNAVLYTIGNIYAPTRNFAKEQVSVFKEFIVELGENITENVIIGGDYNLYMNPRIDKLDSMPDSNDNENYRKDIISFLEVYNLVDVWRVVNPDKRIFTWHRGNIRSRLDYFFISEHLLNVVATVDISPGIHSDHSLLSLSLNTGTTQPRGRGFWKFNSSLLGDPEYVALTKQIISSAKEKYGTVRDKGLAWDLVKLDIRGSTIHYSSKKKRDLEKYEKELNDKYLDLYGKINTDHNVPVNILNEYYEVKSEIETIERHRARGIILRSKSKWVEEGEKNTSYFLRLEKNNYCNKHITQLQVNDKLISDPGDILKEEQIFYENLYSSNTETASTFNESNEFLENTEIPKLTEDQKRKCENYLTEKELLTAIKAMKNGKSPGTDGLTSEFYKFFWTDIKDILLVSLNYALENEYMSIEQKRGILTLIPKKEKNRLFLKNWRPITLLNLDYKILAKALASRLVDVLPFLVEDDQTGYISGRYIGCNIRIVEDIVIYTAQNNIPGILLSIDFEKAFDSLSWSFIYDCLTRYNFGPIFISFIKTLYKGINTAVINNGYISDWFHPQRGVRQGCPISPYLFILAVEVLACNIRQDRNIEGITLGNHEIKISQLADDTTCFIKNEASLMYLFATLRKFKHITGLGVNVDKTIATCLGPYTPSTDNFAGLDWSTQYIHTLGITISGNEGDHYNLNFKKRLNVLKNLLNSWKCRRLSIKGKITVINTLALPPLLYVASVIHVPHCVITQVKKLLIDFIWDGGSPKIAYDTLTQDIKDGGLKLIDIESKMKALKVSWVKRLCDESSGRWKAAPSLFYGTNDLNSYFKFNHKYRSDITINFYTEVHNYWAEINEVHSPSADVICSQVIWNNRYITIGNKTFLWSNWLQHGIVRVRDLMDDDGAFLDCEQIGLKYGIRCNFLNVLQLRQSLPLQWRQVLSRQNIPCKTYDNNEILLHVSSSMITLMKCDTNKFYWFFTKKKLQNPTAVLRWNESYQDISEEWENIFKLSFKTVRETKLQSFQYRIIHRSITCNKKLHDMKMKATPICDYCPATDNILHFFVYCPDVKQLWVSFYDWFNIKNNVGVRFESPCDEVLLFGYLNEDIVFQVLNFCILHLKYYIHRQRLFGNNRFNLQAFINEIKFKLQIEKSCSNQSIFENFSTVINEIC